MEVKEKIQIKKYPAYKDSGVDWLGNVPEAWKLIRMKYLYKDISIKNRPDAELMSVTQDKGVVPRSWVENRMVMPSGNLNMFKFIEKNDFAISLRSFEGGLEYCHHDGIISPAYTVLKRKRNDLEPSFYKYLFKSFSFISELQTSIVGIREGKNISYPELSYSFLPIPSKEEQTAIANFLDEKCEKIDQTIARKEKLIELLKERKQIVIQNAVTKGLDKNLKQKDSGIEWIGEIPEHWDVKAIKHLKKNVKNAFVDGPFGSNLKSEHYIENGDVYVVESGFITTGVFINKEFKTITKKHFETIKRSSCKAGDIIIAKIGANYGMAAELPVLEKEAVVSGNSLKITLNDKLILNEIFVKLLGMSKALGGFEDIVNASAQPALSLGGLNNLKLPIGKIKEQISIVNYIKMQSAKIEKSIEIQELQIEKIKEYKSSLINSAVTGKIKVC